MKWYFENELTILGKFVFSKTRF